MIRWADIFRGGLLLGFIVGFGWPNTWAASKPKEGSEPPKPIVTTADTLELDQKNRVAVFSGSVVTRQEQPGQEPLVIECDKLIIYYTGDPMQKTGSGKAKAPEKKETAQDKVEKIVASGKVRVVQGKDVATAEKATFYNAEQRIVLSGKAEFWQGKNLVKGEEITVWLKENRSRVTSKGTGRVKAVIHQEEK